MRANPRLAAFQRKAQEERQRRGDHGYNDADVRKLAIYFTIEGTNLPRISPQKAREIAVQNGLNLEEFLGAFSWLDPQHADLLRRKLSKAENHGHQ
jgi:hypothetical protein